jgi:NRAMP (natural resistance-associated macrophage protein)-like metal ion transporter
LLLPWSIPDVVIVMGLAGLVNMVASTFFAHGQNNVADINTAYQTLTPLLEVAASTVFAISLLASGLSSSTVGTMAGQVIMQGFVGITIPIWLLYSTFAPLFCWGSPARLRTDIYAYIHSNIIKVSHRFALLD